MTTTLAIKAAIDDLICNATKLAELFDGRREHHPRISGKALLAVEAQAAELSRLVQAVADACDGPAKRIFGYPPEEVTR